MVALLLEANPHLGWRDVQEILAYSAQFNDSHNAGWQYNTAGTWNGGGLHYSTDYGFGAVDALAAVRLAETWGPAHTSANMVMATVTSAGTPHLSIPQIGTGSAQINVAQNILIDHVQATVDISHGRSSDLIITLISPTGTQSILANHPATGCLYNNDVGIEFTFTTNADWGEYSQGAWTLKIQDTVSGRTTDLTSWSLTFYGDTYFRR